MHQSNLQSLKGHNLEVIGLVEFKLSVEHVEVPNLPFFAEGSGRDVFNVTDT